jgi:hypothetical protein
MIILDVQPVGHSQFTGSVNGEALVGPTPTPFFDAARRLMARGEPADETLVMRHPTGTLSIKAALGDAARLGVREGNGQLRIVAWEPYNVHRGI